MATCNDTKRLKAPLLSRFAVINLHEYDKEQFVRVTATHVEIVKQKKKEKMHFSTSAQDTNQAGQSNVDFLSHLRKDRVDFLARLC